MSAAEQGHEIPLSKSEASRERIIDAAHQLFITQGYAATSMRDIARRSGLTMGGIYGHFAGKEEIWSAVFMAKHPYQALLPLIMSSRGETIEEFLRDTARNMLDTLEERPEIFNLLFIELVEFDGKDIEKLSVELLPVIQQLGQKFFSLKGQLQPISALTIVRAFAGLIISFYITGRFVPPIFRMQIDKQKSLDEFIQIFLHGILDESGSASDADRRENG